MRAKFCAEVERCGFSGWLPKGPPTLLSPALRLSSACVVGSSSDILMAIMGTDRHIAATLEHEWLTVAECAEYLRLSTWSIHRYIRRGVLGASQMIPGGPIRIRRKSVEDALHRRMNRPIR